MNDHDRSDEERALHIFKARLLLLAFGVGVLAFLIAIDKPEWFALRPATATAAALSRAADTDQPRGEPNRTVSDRAAQETTG